MSSSKKKKRKKPEKLEKPENHEDLKKNDYSEFMRQERLIFYKEDIEVMDALLTTLVSVHPIQTVLLVDKDGHLILQSGECNGFDATSMAALISASFASTRELSRILGEDDFTEAFHSGQRLSILMNLIGGRSLMVSIYEADPEDQSLRAPIKKCCDKLENILSKASKRKNKDSGIHAGYQNAANDRLNEFFTDE
jgi:predicted regulator of Ras-like GTPase activity (Roadblock/LC7/MglB family)